MIVLGFDPSLSNWGYCKVFISDSGLEFKEYGVIQTKPDKRKIKQNIKDYERCQCLYKNLLPLLDGVDVICVELPTGSQSSRAMVSYSVCIALTACISTIKPNIRIITPRQVKEHTNAVDGSKEHIINWVKDKYPNLKLPCKTKAEHICDSIVAIHVGMGL